MDKCWLNATGTLCGACDLGATAEDRDVMNDHRQRHQVSVVAGLRSGSFRHNASAPTGQAMI